MPWNVIKSHLPAHGHDILPVCSVRSNEKTGARASWVGRDWTRRRGELRLLLFLAFLFPPTWGKQSIFSLTPVRKWLCWNILPVNTGETDLWKSREHQHGPECSEARSHSWASKGTARVILQTIEKANLQEWVSRRSFGNRYRKSTGGQTLRLSHFIPLNLPWRYLKVLEKDAYCFEIVLHGSPVLLHPLPGLPGMQHPYNSLPGPFLRLVVKPSELEGCGDVSSRGEERAGLLLTQQK